MRMRTTAVVLLACAGCTETTMQVENRLPGTNLRNIEFSASASNAYIYQVRSGQRSSRTRIDGEVPGRAGEVSFLAEREGRQVYMRLRDLFDPEDGSNTVLVIDVDTAVEVPALEQSQALAQLR